MKKGEEEEERKKTATVRRNITTVCNGPVEPVELPGEGVAGRQKAKERQRCNAGNGAAEGVVTEIDLGGKKGIQEVWVRVCGWVYKK